LAADFACGKQFGIAGIIRLFMSMCWSSCPIIFILSGLCRRMTVITPNTEAALKTLHSKLAGFGWFRTTGNRIAPALSTSRRLAAAILGTYAA